MNKLLSSHWIPSIYALLIFIGGVIGNLIVNPDLIFILGTLSGSLIIVIINCGYVIYKQRKSK